MSDALLAGVSGLKAHQTMIDVAGNNLANLNTSAFKSSRVTFADMLSTTVKEASQPTSTMGGTNPQQIGSGVKVASIDRNMEQGSLINTGEPLDMAIEGNGYFVLNDGVQDVFTRVGRLAVDAEYYLVDPGTGYRVQRIGSEGVNEGFQDPASGTIQIPYDMALPASTTTSIGYSGNLTANTGTTPTTNRLYSGIEYTTFGSPASATTYIVDLDQASGFSGTLVISGTARDGAAVGPVNLVVDAATTVGDLLDAINGAFTGATSSLFNGQIVLADDEAGYSQTNLEIAVDAGATGTLELPRYFQLAPGGATIKDTNVEIFDTQGVSHILSGSFVKTNTPNTWDFVITSMTGDVSLEDRRIRGLTFTTNGGYGGLDPAIGDTQALRAGFACGNYAGTDIAIQFGTIGEFDGLTQFGGASTVAPSGQDGYSSGVLSSLSVTREGVLVGVFTNGVRKDIAAIRVATFQNPAALEGAGGSYYIASENSGEPVPSKALAGGAGAIHGGSLEGSNVEVAMEFVNLIQAQNGYQANARTITITNEMLRELTNLIR
jgi:flagellar hook protein FlgE